MNEHMPHEEMPLGKEQPGGWEADLHADRQEGRNTGVMGQHPEMAPGNTAYDVKPVHRMLHDLPDDDLKQIPVLPPGSRLEQGATYIDLTDPARAEFTAMGGQSATAGHWYVPKAGMDARLWNYLTKVTNSERLGEASET